ncbi:GNAT family N-acetyltransferase [Alcaligenaceae bacterium]|nr:GNAT family N-acetyltransferase [Alcaligenaceae bacterium]
MPRHSLFSLFEPRTLVVVSERTLSVTQVVPPTLEKHITQIDVLNDQAIVLPHEFAGVAPGERVDQAVICVSHGRLPDALSALRHCKPRVVLLLPGHIPAPEPLEDLAYARAWGAMNDCMVLGPRSFGIQRPHLQLNLSLNQQEAQIGRVALVTQSRTITAAVLDWAADINLGFSAVVSLGDEAVLDVADILDYLAMDPRTDSIALYLEDTSSSRSFSSALRAAASVKPVVVLKIGAGASDAISDAGDAAMAEDAVFNALVRRAGAVRIRYFVQLFSALKVLVYTRHPKGRRIALFSNGDGAAQLALDVMGPSSAVFSAELSSATITALKSALEPGAVTANPVISYAPLAADRAKNVMDILVNDAGVDGVLVLLAPDPFSDLKGVAHQLAEIAPDARKPIITCFIGDASMRPLRHVLDHVGTPAFRTPESAANAFGILASYHYNQTLSLQMLPPEPLSKPPRLDEARALLRTVQIQRRHSLNEDECERLLACFYVPIHYKEELAEGKHHDDDSLPMAIRVRRDNRFGPFIVFGSGGQDALISGSYRAVELPPLNNYLARQLVQRSSLWRNALSHQMTPAAFELLRETLERISDMICELPELESLAIDPLFAAEPLLNAGAIRIAVSPKTVLVLPENAGYGHLAIHPYPRRLTEERSFKDGGAWLMRPIRPEDAQALQEFVRGLSDESRYMRFVSMLRELTPRMLARYTRIDYDRELALVATVQLPNPEHRGHLREHIVGFAHYLRNPDGRGAEYALAIGDAWHRRGLGAQLMGGLINAAQEQGLTYIDGVVLSSNRPMLALMTHLGFQNDQDAEDPTMRRVWLDLGETRLS